MTGRNRLADTVGILELDIFNFMLKRENAGHNISIILSVVLHKVSDWLTSSCLTLNVSKTVGTYFKNYVLVCITREIHRNNLMSSSKER